MSLVSQLVPQPWWSEVERLHCQGVGASEIAERLQKDVLLICNIMEHPSYKSSLAIRQQKIDTLFVARLLDLWEKLSGPAIEVARVTMQAYLDKMKDGADEKEIRALRRDAITVMTDIQDRIGLKAPEKIEVKSLMRSETADVTPLDVYEKRLALVREYKEAGLEIPDDLGKVNLDG